jgi:hypothetical protein
VMDEADMRRPSIEIGQRDRLRLPARTQDVGLASGLHRYHAWPQLSRKLDHSLAAHASPQHDGSVVIQPDDAAAVLAQINPENCDFHCLFLRIGCPKTLCPRR